MKKFDLLQILKDKHKLPNNLDFNRENVQDALDFLLVWNYFESLLNNDAKFSNIDEGFKKCKLDSSVRKDIVELYSLVSQQNLRSSNQHTLILDDFNRAKIDICIDFYNHQKNTISKDYNNVLNFIKSEIIKTQISDIDKLKIIVYISKIVRNNMFHGTKELPEFWHQKEFLNILSTSLKIYSFDIGLYHGILDE